MIGDVGVGKTFMIHRFIGEELSSDNPLPTISVEYYDKTITLSNNKKIKIELWDTGKLFFFIKKNNGKIL